jgi:hypothetical protein
VEDKPEQPLTGLNNPNAQDIGFYKPNLRNFNYMIEKLGQEAPSGRQSR